MWAVLVPSVLSALSLGFHVQLSGAFGQVVSLAAYIYCGALLASSCWSLVRGNPGVLRLRVTRRMLVGFGIMIIGLIGLAITDGILDQSAGPAFLVFFVVVLGGMVFILVALFIGLFYASKDVIERYHSEHAGASDA
jgi:hypothetical protein